MKRVYLDYSATTPIDPKVYESMKPYFLEKYGNASSIHSFGQEVKISVEESRAILAKKINALPREIVFTGSGTEANNFAIKGIAKQLLAKGKRHIVTSQIEHHSVLHPCEYLIEQGFSISYCRPNKYGIITEDEVEKCMQKDTGLVSIMHVNNEIGTINPVEKIGQIAKKNDSVFHIDAIQSFCKLPIDVEILHADLLSMSAHKIYGPKGIGALYIRSNVEVDPFIHGGSQERGKRAGTEPSPLIIGFGKAVEIMSENSYHEKEQYSNQKKLFHSLLKEYCHKILGSDVIILNGNSSNTLDSIVSISFDNSKFSIEADTLLLNMDIGGIAVSSGSACTSGSENPSHVLLALGHDVNTAKATLRFSFGRYTTNDDLEDAVKVLSKILLRMTSGKS